MGTVPSRAFTLVELLVVIAIISVMLAMVFPALSGAREAARRTTCASRLCELGVALGEYQAAHGSLPPGTTEPKGPIRNVAQGNHISWLVHLLPYLGERATFNHVDLAAGAYDKKNEPVRAIHVAGLVCPSDRYVEPTEIGKSSYAGCHHDLEAPIDVDNHGVLFLNSHIAEKDVSDGPAQTIYIGEKTTSADDLGWLSGTRATLRNAGTPIGSGRRLPAAAPLAGAASAPKVEAPVGAEADLVVGGFGACHPAGANFLFGDGAVQLLNRDIDTDVYQQLAHRADGKLLTGGPTRGQ
jgi:prepilin-type N-terminal cleavage/methylation domain-containing protein/prepilin-type processing-associated H-X9-DG protein